jgi:hypothetical protein
MERKVTERDDKTPTRTPERISRFSTSSSRKSMMQLPGLGQESPFKNSQTISSRNQEQNGVNQYDSTREQSRHDQSRQYDSTRYAYTPSRSTPNSNYVYHSPSYPQTPLAFQDSPTFTPTKQDLQFKMPRAIVRDTPRPNQNLGQVNQLRRAFAPSVPSPLNFLVSGKELNGGYGGERSTDVGQSESRTFADEGNESRTDVDINRRESRTDIDTNRQESRTDIDINRQESRTDIDINRQESRTDIDINRQESRTDIDINRQESRTDIDINRESKDNNTNGGNIFTAKDHDENQDSSQDTNMELDNNNDPKNTKTTKKKEKVDKAQEKSETRSSKVLQDLLTLETTS